MAFVAGPDFMLEGGRSSLRLSFASVPPERIAEGVARISRGAGAGPGREPGLSRAYPPGRGTFTSALHRRLHPSLACGQPSRDHAIATSTGGEPTMTPITMVEGARKLDAVERAQARRASVLRPGGSGAGARGIGASPRVRDAPPGPGPVPPSAPDLRRRLRVGRSGDRLTLSARSGRSSARAARVAAAAEAGTGRREPTRSRRRFARRRARRPRS